MGRKKRIVFIDTPISPEQGGGQKSLLLLLRNLPGEKFDIAVVVPEGPDGGFAKDVCAEGLALQKVRISFSAVWQALRQLSPDLVHCNSATTRMSFLAALCAKLQGIPFVWHVRVLEQAGWKDKVIAGLSSKIVVISSAVSRRFSWVSGKVVKVFNAVDTRLFAPGLATKHLRNEFGIPSGGKVVGTIGRLVGFKGHKIFLRMAEKVSEKYGECRFLIVGSGDEEYVRELKEYCTALKLGGKVVFTGHRNDIPEIISLCDVIVSPSSGLEAFGRTLIEAMACGKPVVAGDAGGMPEIIDNGRDGILVGAASAEDYAAAVLDLIASPDRAAELGKNGLEKVKRYFSVEQHILNIERIYSELMP